MAQVKNSIFSETSKKNKDGIVNIPIDIGKIKEELQKESISSIFSTSGLISHILDELMENEMATFLNASKSERTEMRKGYRNGSYFRTLITTIGKLELQVPRDRNGEFQTTVFERFNRVEKAFCSTVAEMVLNGVSTRSVKYITELLCGTKFSHSTVSEMVKSIEPVVDEFKARPIVGVHKYVHVDGMYIKVRVDNKVSKRCVYIALGYDDDGKKTILGYEIAKSENTHEYVTFLNHLKEKGLTSPQLFITDGNEGLKNAIDEVFPEAQWQYCASHLYRNTLRKTANKYKQKTAEMLKTFKTIKNPKLANEYAHAICDFLCSKKQFEAMKTFDNSYQDTLTYLNFNSEIHRCIFTNNAVERANSSVRKREKPIKIFPNVASANRLIGAILLDVDEAFLTGNQNFAMIADLAQT